MDGVPTGGLGDIQLLGLALVRPLAAGDPVGPRGQDETATHRCDQVVRPGFGEMHTTDGELAYLGGDLADSGEGLAPTDLELPARDGTSHRLAPPEGETP